MPEWLIPLASIVLGAASGWVTFRIRFERFEAAYNEREKQRREQREEIINRVLKLEDRPQNGYSELIFRIEAIEREIGDSGGKGIRGRLHYDREAMAKLSERVHALEQRRPEHRR